MHHTRTSILLLAALLPVRNWGQTPTAEAMSWARQAVGFQQSGDYTAAAEAYRKVLDLRPDDVASHVNLGVVLVRLGRFDEAIGEYQAADRLLPGDPRIALNEALAYEKSGQLGEAGRRFEALHAAAPQDTRVAMLLADCHLQMGEYDKVIDLLRPLDAELPDDPGIAYMLGMALLENRRIPEGQAVLDRILRRGDSAESRFLLGTRMFESGDYPAAVKQLAGAAELNPELPQLQSLYARALLRTGDPDAALEAFRRELATNPNDYASNIGLGQILAVRRQFTDALAPLRQALRLRPKAAEAEQALAECLNGLGEFQEAKTHAVSAVQAAPDSLEAHRALWTSYNGLRQQADAARERKTVESLEQSASASAPGPKLHEMAPDFELPDVSTGQTVRLSGFRGRSAVAVVFGSYSCPNFRASAAALKDLQRRYGAKVPFLLVYIREAHAGESWQSTRNLREGVELAQASTFEEKKDHATMCSRQLHLPFPALVDRMDGAVEAAYGAWPSRAFIVGVDGRILFSTRLTEQEFHAEEMESVLRAIVSHKESR